MRSDAYLNSNNPNHADVAKQVQDYVENKDICKNKLILTYFDETTTEDCKTCSVCTSKRKEKQIAFSKDNFKEKVLALLRRDELDSQEIQNETKLPSDLLIEILNELIDEEKVTYNNIKYKLK